MSRRPPALLLLLLPVIAGCGGGAPDRPVLLDSFPANGSTLATPLAAVRVRYDAPVRILNPDQVSVVQPTGGIPVQVSVDATDPTLVWIVPDPGSHFFPGEATVTIGPGLVVNHDDQYALDDVVLDFTVGDADAMFAAIPSPASVVSLDFATWSALSVTPTPGGRLPVGVAATNRGGAPRVWTSLATGGGTGEALAFFAPGSAAMTPVSLTFDAGGDLSADAAALAVSPDQRTLYAAFRDEGLGQVRLAAVDTATGTEKGTLVLSPPADATTRPLGLTVGPSGAGVLVPCRAPGGDVLVRVDTGTFQEVDLDDALPGIEGLPLPAGGGPVGVDGQIAFVSVAGGATADMTLVDLASAVRTASPSAVSGASDSLLLTPDLDWVVQGLAGFAPDAPLVVRSPVVPLDPMPVAISDRTEAGPGSATSVTALAARESDFALVVFLDDDVVTVLHWSLDAFTQEDLAPGTVDVDGIDLSAVAPGVRAATFVPGAYP